MKVNTGDLVRILDVETCRKSPTMSPLIGLVLEVKDIVGNNGFPIVLYKPGRENTIGANSHEVELVYES